MAKGSRLAGVADGLVPRRRAGMPDVITCTSEGDDPSGRGRQGVDRPDDAPAGPAQGCELGATTRETHAPAVAGNPCASRMIPLESPVPEIGTPGSESGGRKRAYGLRTAARLRKRRTSHRALPVTRLPSTLHESGRYPTVDGRRTQAAGDGLGCSTPRRSTAAAPLEFFARIGQSPRQEGLTAGRVVPRRSAPTEGDRAPSRRPPRAIRRSRCSSG